MMLFFLQKNFLCDLQNSNLKSVTFILITNQVSVSLRYIVKTLLIIFYLCVSFIEPHFYTLN